MVLSIGTCCHLGWEIPRNAPDRPRVPIPIPIPLLGERVSPSPSLPRASWHPGRAIELLVTTETPRLGILPPARPTSLKDIAIRVPAAVCLSYRGRWPNKPSGDIRSRAGAGGNSELLVASLTPTATMKLLLLLALVALAQCSTFR